VLDQVPEIRNHETAGGADRQRLFPRLQAIINRVAGAIGELFSPQHGIDDFVTDDGDRGPGQIDGDACGRQPAPIDEDNRRGAQPGSVVDRNARMVQTIEIGKLRPNQHTHFARGKEAELFTGQRGLPAQQIEDGAHQGQWLEVVTAVVLEQANTHGPHPFVPESVGVERQQYTASFKAEETGSGGV
jgi:hypothetical protein